MKKTEISNMKGGKRYEQAVGRIRELLERWLESGVDLFLAMREIEHAEDWKLPGHASFIDFLRAEFPNAIGFERYNNVIQAIELHGEGFVRKIGVHACHAVSIRAIAESQEARAQLVASVEEHINQHGVVPDANKIRRIAQGIVRAPSRPAAETTTALLRAEVKKLRIRVRELEAECESLRAMLEKSGAPEGGSRKAKSKRSELLRV